MNADGKILTERDFAGYVGFKIIKDNSIIVQCEYKRGVSFIEWNL